jgi:hypothetical protein
MWTVPYQYRTHTFQADNGMATGADGRNTVLYGIMGPFEWPDAHPDYDGRELATGSWTSAVGLHTQRLSVAQMLQCDHGQ